MDVKKLSLFDLLSQAEASEKKVDLSRLYGEVLAQKSNAARQPLAAQMELLPLCNFRCKFCYVRMSPAELAQSGGRLLRFADWKWYIDEACKLGVSSVTFTGGECTIHPDFLQIYEYAYEKGLQVGMISNGSMITDEILALFDRCPPSKIYITLYGMSADTYAALCGDGAAFARVMANIDRLRTHKFNVILNYTAGKENFGDLETALAFAREKKLTILPTNALQLQGKCDAQTLQAELVDYYAYQKIEHRHLSLLREEPFEAYERRYFSTFYDPVPSEAPRGLGCNAARCMFTVSWQGRMKPCANFDLFTVDPRETGMQAAWEQLVAWADQVPVLEECETCIFQPKCRRCAALHYGDMGEFGKVSPRFCFKVLHPKEAAQMQADYEAKKAEAAAQQVTS